MRCQCGASAVKGWKDLVKFSKSKESERNNSSWSYSSEFIDLVISECLLVTLVLLSVSKQVGSPLLG